MLPRNTVLAAACLSISISGLVTLPAFGQLGLQPGAPVGSGQPLLFYDSSHGNVRLDANGGPAIGLFQLESVSGIFTGEAAMLPADGLFRVDNDFEIAKAAFSTVTSLNLGNVAQTGLFPAFLLQDLVTAYVSCGFGCENIPLSLPVGPPLGPPVAIDGSISVLTGDLAMHQFQYEPDSVHPKDSALWSDLILTGDAGQSVAIAASLSTSGLFEWDTTGSPVGNYTALATVTSRGGSDLAMLSINVAVPEPASMLLFGLALASMAWLRRR
jgi:hypothetical protein